MVLRRTALWTTLTLTVVALTTVIPTGSAWGAERSAIYEWGEPWGLANSSHAYPSPTAVRGVPGTVVQISTSNSTSYALTKDGQVWAWGAGVAGALGNGATPAFSVNPVRVKFPKGVTIASLPSPMPFDTGMAIDSRGRAWGWGSNVNGSLCIKSNTLKRPKRLPFRHVTMASGAGGHALYLAGGVLYACGENTDGELGDGTTTRSTRPVRVVGLPQSKVTTLVASWEDSGALLADGLFFAWGYDAADQLGNGGTTNSASPVQVDLSAKVQQVSMGGSNGANGQTIAILSDGSVWDWGSNSWGQLGDGKMSKSSGPVAVDVPSGVSFAQVDSGGATTYGIEKDGAVWSWGQNNVGELGTQHRGPSAKPILTSLVMTCVSSTAWNVEGWHEPQHGGVGCAAPAKK